MPEVRCSNDWDEGLRELWCSKFVRRARCWHVEWGGADYRCTHSNVLAELELDEDVVRILGGLSVACMTCEEFDYHLLQCIECGEGKTDLGAGKECGIELRLL